MTKLIAILLIGLVLGAVGVVLLSQGLHEIGEVKKISAGEIGRHYCARRGNAATSILGVLFEALLLWRAALPALAKGRQPGLAIDVPRLCHYRAGGAFGQGMRRSARCAGPGWLSL